LSLIGGPSGIKALNSLPTLLNSVMKRLVKVHENKYKALVSSTKVNFGEVVSNIPRTKLVKAKDSKTNKVVERKEPIHLTKPSSNPLTTFSVEIEYLRLLDGPWTNMQSLAETYKNGVPLDKLEAAREEYKKFYEAQFINNSKLVSWRSRKATGLNYILSLVHPKPRGKELNYSPKYKDDIILWLNSEFSDETLSDELETAWKDIKPGGLCGDSDSFRWTRNVPTKVIFDLVKRGTTKLVKSEGALDQILLLMADIGLEQKELKSSSKEEKSSIESEDEDSE